MHAPNEDPIDEYFLLPNFLKYYLLTISVCPSDYGWVVRGTELKCSFKFFPMSKPKMAHESGIPV
jgi:hypothetical protein